MFHSRARLLTGSVVALTTALSLSACGSKGGDSAGATCIDTSGDSVKVGFLNSLSGTMAISEKVVSQSLHMAADEINAKGGVMGKKLDIVQEDGASDPDTFAQKAGELITKDCVAAVFGGWTSASRKAMLPVFEGDDSILFYPVQYEGLEASHNIFYTGATTNQQIIPALDYLKKKGIKSLFLVGSDYVFPRTANKIIKEYAAANGIAIKGEEYIPLGSTDGITTIVNKIKAAGADAVFNSLNGDQNVAFFKEYKNEGLSPQQMPVVSVSIGEQEVPGVGVSNLVGQLTAWNYYETLQSPENATFVKDFKAYAKDSKAVTDDPMEAAYTSLYLYKAMVEKAGSFDPEKVIAAAGGVSFDAPEGKVTVNGENHHIAKTFLMGQVQPTGLIDVIGKSSGPIEPDPFLKTYPWWKG
ncbi:MAG TPA: urea ABC transporter substrate-binding protein [Nocardioides sp.]|nr:urea ABC transporter substrate-binding protein [Nocardioides sp.]